MNPYTTGGTINSGQNTITISDPGENWSLGGVIDLTIGGKKHLYPNGKHGIASVVFSDPDVVITLNDTMTRNTDFNVQYFSGGI